MDTAKRGLAARPTVHHIYEDRGKLQPQILWAQMTTPWGTTDATVAMLLRVRAQVKGNHNRVHASLKSSRGPRGLSVAGSP